MIGIALIKLNCLVTSKTEPSFVDGIMDGYSRWPSMYLF